MALKRIFNMSYAGGSKFTIYDVTETIRLEEGGSGVEITTINAGSKWTSTNEIFVGIFIGNTLIAGEQRPPLAVVMGGGLVLMETVI